MAYVEALTGTDIDFGKALWDALRGNKKFPANGALWLFHPESDEWHLLIATPRVDEVGPRKATRNCQTSHGAFRQIRRSY